MILCREITLLVETRIRMLNPVDHTDVLQHVILSVLKHYYSILYTVQPYIEQLETLKQQ